MEITHAKTVLDAILEGCEDEAIITELIDKAWTLIKDGPKPPEPDSPPPGSRNLRKPLEVNGRTFTSTASACKYYKMEDQYKTVLNDLKAGVHPEDIFPKEPPTPKTRMNIDQRTGVALPN